MPPPVPPSPYVLLLLFFECPAQPRPPGTLASGLATSRPILLLLTSLLFLVLTLISGQILHYLLHSSTMVSKAVFSPPTSTPIALYDNWDEDYVVINGGGLLIWDVVLGAVRTFSGVAQRFTASRPEFTGFLLGATIRFLLGLAVLGSLSFLSLILSMSLFAPLQVFNGFRTAGLGIFRRHRRDGASDGTGFGQVVIIIFVLIGAANTLVRVYSGLQLLTERLLFYVETQILEVNSDERRTAREKSREVLWWRRWVKEGRWKRRDGWREVGWRGWVTLKGWVERMRG